MSNEGEPLEVGDELVCPCCDEVAGVISKLLKDVFGNGYALVDQPNGEQILYPFACEESLH